MHDGSKAQTTIHCRCDEEVVMVQLTAEAAEVLDQVKKTYEIPPSHGLRFFREEYDGGQVPEVSIMFVPRPEQGDAVTTVRNTRMFVAPEVEDRLEGASLEAKAGDRPIIAIKYPDDG
jgi:hypothetical protein